MTAKPDWEQIERDYRAGVVSLRGIADRDGNVTEGAIRKRAKKYGWKRDLTGKVRAAARAKLAVDLGAQDDGTQSGTQKQRMRTEAEIVEDGGETQAQVVRTHRTDIRRARKACGNLLGELEASTQHREQIEESVREETKGDRSSQRRNRMLSAVSLPGRASTLRDLSLSMQRLVALERQAFSIDDEQPPQDADNTDVNALSESIASKLAGIAAGGSEG